ncbi:2Fe-2S iron-sulfur cluster-binding protein [Jongsikchunia kroppenstedtii]|uniref:2Fe-2S iron-sulfur cluster-binding protein n=1 Tax=Jongsikchunia kroppenstedtii TaxID=1121721 RepID=UPI00035DC90E|nr:2Fe-2S iron-sulfur cluster binding domain-containing protein [Jongsikchunia kroppenstedtii]
MGLFAGRRRAAPARPSTGSAPVADPTRSFSVRLESDGRTFVVPPGRSILQVLTDAGVEVDSFCRNGICGTCEQNLVSGEPEHRDSFLTADERAAGQRIMICVSRARPGETLVLDL